ncbi:tyrosine-type recombinase/integrase [uncultured Akkermansia sp.]|uniref:tyrosine-type recombinase/integrase n=1 Tax=uncultured Akkermansia sp. TaxID=512294 RepID=UPI002622597E|nr:tyrosine-type recombinase/integrase [uncultured Akkermansia sp.]
MAGVIKRGNKYFAAFRLAGKQVRLATGVDVYPKGYTGKNPPREQRARAELIAEELEKAARGEKVDGEKVKALAGERKGREMLKGKHYVPGVSEYLATWLSGRNGKQVEKDRVAVRLFLEFLGDAKDMPLDMVTRVHVRRFMEKQLERVTAGTVRFYLALLKAAFNQAITAGLLAANPFSGVRAEKARRGDKQERKAFTLEEVRRLLDVLPGEWPDMVRVCLYTGGQRLGDIARLKWEQIDLGGGLIAMTTQKTGRRMNKPVIAPLKAVLGRLPSRGVSEYLFPVAAVKHAAAGGMVSKLSNEFRGLLLEHGFIAADDVPRKGDRRKLAELSFHSLRATAVTVLRNAGVAADLCRFIVGHDSEEIERVYFRPDGEAVKAAMEPLERIEL